MAVLAEKAGVLLRAKVGSGGWCTGGMSCGFVRGFERFRSEDGDEVRMDNDDDDDDEADADADADVSHLVENVEPVDIS